MKITDCVIFSSIYDSPSKWFLTERSMNMICPAKNESFVHNGVFVQYHSFSIDEKVIDTTQPLKLYYLLKVINARFYL